MDHSTLHNKRRAALPGRLALGILALALGGCASVAPDGGFGAVQQTVGDRLGTPATLVRARDTADLDRIDQRVAELLRQPLDMDAAVQVALLNNRGLQAALADLGIT